MGNCVNLCFFLAELLDRFNCSVKELYTFLTTNEDCVARLNASEPRERFLSTMCKQITTQAVAVDEASLYGPMPALAFAYERASASSASSASVASSLADSKSDRTARLVPVAAAAAAAAAAVIVIEDSEGI
jgi:hypothetical protein